MERNEQLCSWCEDIADSRYSHWCAYIQNEEPDVCSCEGTHNIDNNSRKFGEGRRP